MDRLSNATSSWLFGFLVAIAVCACVIGFAGFGAELGFGQASSTSNSTAAANSNTTPAAQFGALYGASAGNRDGTLRLSPRPGRSQLYGNQREYKSAYGSLADYAQQYRSAFEKAYRLSYEKALNNHDRQTKHPQTSASTTGSN
jgi:hypothetical protein